MLVLKRSFTFKYSYAVGLFMIIMVCAILRAAILC